MKYLFLLTVLILFSLSNSAQSSFFNLQNDTVLSIPELSLKSPEPGKTGMITPIEFKNTQVYHTVYLPSNWDKNWKENGIRYPIIFEYTGNYFPASGSSGEVKDAALGYGLTGGTFIWVSLPYISKNKQHNELTWWGDTEATVNYAKKYVPEIINEFGGDKSAVFLCGFSRGAIGVNYIGLHDDEVSKLWTAFITHDHFDGVKEWKGRWGSPLEKYRAEAEKRLKRVGGRPYLVIQNGADYGTKQWVESVLPKSTNFKFLTIDTKKIFGNFPNKIAKHEHTDRWLLLPGEYRTETWNWINNVLDYARFNQLTNKKLKQVFFDSCTGSWQKNWTLDGKKATLLNSEKGMDFMAGPNRREDASHAVLWTKKSFSGDIRIDYEYTKTDNVHEAVTIIYILATGKGSDGFDKDISKWASRREVPAMNVYFRNMNTYHISYAAFRIGNKNIENDYIRARRYMPDKNKGLRNTDLNPDYFNTGLFKKDVAYKITIIKSANDLFMRIKGPDKEQLCRWRTTGFPPINEGRIGLRHMWTRGARYKNFTISKLIE